jgi:hypothetical protein
MTSCSEFPSGSDFLSEFLSLYNLHNSAAVRELFEACGCASLEAIREKGKDLRLRMDENAGKKKSICKICITAFLWRR